MNEKDIYSRLENLVGPRIKLVVYSIGFIAGGYSLLLSRPIVDNLFKIFLLFVIWYPLLILCSIANAWGVHIQVKELHRSGETADKVIK